MDHLLCFLTLILSQLPIQSLVEAKIGGFSIELIHPDSQLSPFYNHSATPGELSRNSALRSIARANHFHQSSISSIDENKIESMVLPSGGGYLMKLSIGSPPVETLAIADTGSDLVWVQCQPCQNCYTQKDPLFDPRKSSTYMELSCDSKNCQDLPRSGCGSTNNECLYSYSYGDRSYTNGVLTTDTFTFDSTSGEVAAFPNSVFGCGYDNGGTFDGQESGLVGLGGGPLSLVSQLATEIEQKFSYCLLPRTVNSASKLKFGTDAVLSGQGIVSTPLSGSDTFYYLTLEAVSVGDKRTENPSTTSNSEGNIIIDSGTTLTLLEPNFYNDIKAAITEAINLNPVQDPQGTFDLCYDKNSFSTAPELKVIFHFTGADVTLKTLNTFEALDYITCLTIFPTEKSAIFGNRAQINFRVAYDLARKQVSFAPADCTQY